MAEMLSVVFTATGPVSLAADVVGVAPLVV
jgi:hypothetical protein